MFGKNKLTAEEIQERIELADQYACDGNFSAIFDIAYSTEKVAPGNMTYWLGCCYINGWGTEQNYDRGIKCMEDAIRYNNNTGYSYYVGGLALYRKADYVTAIEWFSEAEARGVEDSTAFIADAAAALALNTWSEVRLYRGQNDIAIGVSAIKSYLKLAQDKYMEAAKDHPDSMTPAFYVGFGNTAILYYNLATLGYLDLNAIDESSLTDLFFAGANIVSEKWNTEKHDVVYKIGVITCDFIEECGEKYIAEYFRAYLALMESERHKSAQAFYRARWHLKRVGELRSVVGEPLASKIAGYMTDVDAKYKALDKKYGSAVLSMMRSGTLPDISVSYAHDNAPEVESCESFMMLFNDQQKRTTTNASSNSEPEAKKGFFSKLFGK